MRQVLKLGFEPKSVVYETTMLAGYTISAIILSFKTVVPYISL